MTVKRTVVRLLLAIIGVVLLLLVGFVIYLNYNLTRISRDAINDAVNKRSNGVYKIRYDEIDVSIFNSTVRLDQIHFYSDTTESDSLQKHNDSYDIKVDQLTIELTSIIPLLTKKELYVDRVFVNSPVVQLRKSAAIDTTDEQKEVLRFYDYISDHFRSFYISEFNIEDGSFHYLNSGFKIKHVDFSLRNVYVDQYTSDSTLLENEEVSVSIKQQRLALPDSIHIAEYDLFYVSTEDSVLRLQNLSIEPIATTKDRFEKNQKERLLHVCVPEIKLSGIDFYKIYHEKRLYVKEIFIDNPDVLLEDHSSTSNRTVNREQKQLEVIFNDYINSVKVDHFRLDNGSFDVVLIGKKEEHRFEIADADFDFYQFHIDSSNFRFNKKDDYFQNAVITLRDQSYHLRDSLHQFSFKELNLNTFDSTLLITDLRVHPLQDSLPDSIAYVNLHLPKIFLNQLDYLTAIKTKKLETGVVMVNSPKLFVHTNASRKATELNITPQDLLSKIDRYFDVFNSDEIVIKDGEIQVDNRLTVGSVNLFTAGTERIRSTTDWEDLFSNIGLRLGEIDIDNNKFSVQIDQLILSDSNRIIIKDADFYGLKGKGKVKQTIVYNLNLDSLLSANTVIIDSADLFRPSVDLKLNSKNKQKGQYPEFLKVLNFKEAFVSVNLDEKFNLALDKVSGKIINKEEFTIQRLSLQSTKCIFLEDKLVLNTGGLKLFPASRNLRLNDISIKATDSTNVDVFIPQIAVENWNQRAFWDKDDIVVDRIGIDELRLIYQRKKEKKGKGSKLSNFPDLNVKQISLDKALLNINTGDFALQTPRLKFDLNDVKIKENDIDAFIRSQPKFSFSSDSINLKFKNNAITANKLVYKDNAVSLLNSRFKNSYNGSKASMKEMLVTNLDYVQLYFNSRVIADKIELKRPDAHIIVKERKNEKETSNDIPLVLVKSIVASKANFKFEKGKLQHEVDNLNFTLDNLKITEKDKSSNPFHYIDNLKLNGGPYIFVSDDGLNTFKIDKYDINYAQSKITLHNITLTPKYDKLEFTKHIKQQRNWINLKLDAITLSKINFDEYIETDRLNIGLVEAYDADLKVFKDRNVPLPTRIKSMPQALLRGIDENIHIDSVKVTGNIVYEELAEGAQVIGSTTFDQMKGTLKTIQTGGYTSQPMQLNASGYLMNTAAFDAEVIFDMNSPKNDYHFTGEVQEMDLKTFNPMLIPIVNIKVVEGRNMGVNFDFRGDSLYSEGEMYFNYRNLKVKVLDSETLDEGGIGHDLLSFFANTFVIKKHNQAFPYLRKGLIFFERDNTKSIMHMWSWSLMSGVINSIGIKRTERERERFLEKED